ncbi:AraC family transcriptional regulator [Endozoicomonas sp. OPT23]|uniref:choline metabolism transcriptional regulator GbdR n=1 Tax=Endozoicomonas sp. OPT23 TaxID=2072845 RepID=UPI00129AF592|nr:GlxA family transcriptional regulator [Endozoicomonas sp. OPT23]MRI33149.1 AraC family transcriptional regulator [Endozoicomonas sp. OPT23]
MVSGTPQSPLKRQDATSVGFLLLNNFTMLAMASALETLRMANQLFGSELFSWTLISEDGEPVKASDGIIFTPDHSISDNIDVDILIVVGGVNITRSFNNKHTRWLRSKAQSGKIIGGICTGPYVLADAGLLDNQECSAHWECIASLQEHYQRVRCNNKLFTIEHNRMTSSGGSASMDMFLHLITLRYGSKLSTAVSDMFVCDRIRTENDRQRVPLRQSHNTGESRSKLVDIIELMESNLEEPIELDELASFVHVSRRQLERMFQRHLSCSPSRHYLKLRLDRARQLLKQSSMSIVEVAAACGFVSTPHFSRCYRKYNGISPRDDRKGSWQEPTHTTTVINKLALGPVEAKSQSVLNESQAEPSFGSVSVNI